MLDNTETFTTSLVRRATVDEIVNKRNRALELYAIAHFAVEGAETALREAREHASWNRPNDSYLYHSRRDHQEFMNSLTVPMRGDFLKTAKRITDAAGWGHIMEITDLEKLMDKKAKDELRRQLTEEPPELTVDNVFATLEQFSCDAGTIFKRGIAECFSKLDRRFRSHDGWKIGNRVILSNAFDEWGSWSYYRNHRDTIFDIERTFMILDGKKVPDVWNGLVGAIDNERQRDSFRNARQTEIETDYFIVRIYKNGNAHIWFKRDDLLESVNKLLGQYYGNPLPEDRAPDVSGLYDPKTSVAKNFGFYPTPDDAAEILMRDLPFYHDKNEPAPTVLEPSAGTGNLARKCVENGGIVDCIEIFGERCDGLRRENIYRKVIQSDFLAVQPDPKNLYDLIVMNPPFDRERDIDHVLHALKFLKLGGTLTAIMSAGTEVRETKKSEAFRKLIETYDVWRGGFSDLPARSFSSVGTNCNTVILKLKSKK